MKNNMTGQKSIIRKILNWLRANFITVILTGIVIPTVYWLIPAPTTRIFGLKAG
jgi:hypothetical protein